LAVPYSENRLHGDIFHSHGDHKIECSGQTPEDSTRGLLLVFPTMAGSMEQACAQGPYFEGHLVSFAVLHTVTVKHHCFGTFDCTRITSNIRHIFSSEKLRYVLNSRNVHVSNFSPKTHIKKLLGLKFEGVLYSE
jgi:hypothetical protein